MKALVAISCLLMASTAAAQDPSPEPHGDAARTVFTEHGTSWLWLSGQLNVITQAHGSFPAAYSGPHSLRPTAERTTSTLMTAYTGVRLPWQTDVMVDVEAAGGRGLSDALGLGGFTDLDVVRNPDLGAAPYLARLIVHHTIALDSRVTAADASPLALSTRVPVHRLEFWAGKFGTADFFDVNSAGSDSHLQFMNWTVDNDGAYDYAADTRGYTVGALAEYHDARWALRFGELLMPKVANGLELDWNVRRARAENVEVEWRTPSPAASPGVVRALTFVNHANMGDYRAAIDRFSAGTDAVPTIENTRQQGRVKYGFGVNAEEPLTSSLRVFGRAGWNEPHFESFAYTEVNTSTEVGADVSGARWRRREDRLGAAWVANGLSADHRRYLALGGSGFLLGDGRLDYRRERIIESYYTAHVWRGIFASGDVQRIVNPGYNHDRGPVLVAGARLHVDF